MKAYEPKAGTSIDQAATEAHEAARKSGMPVSFDFNGCTLTARPDESENETRLAFRTQLGLPAVDAPFHPVTAKDALERWDKGENVFSIEMGGIGPAYEQAIQILVFEIIRDNLETQFPDPATPVANEWYRTFADATVSRIDEKMGGYSGAMVGAARQVAYRALRDGWGEMVKSIPEGRLIQVSKKFPNLC